MNRVNFNYNWNNKLSCSAFTSLRLKNEGKYIAGERYEITLKEKKLFEADLVSVKHLLINDINEFIAHIDTGYNRAKCIEIIQTMYKNKSIDWNTQKISFLLFSVVKNTVSNPAASNDKIAMFCECYEQHLKIKYRVSAADSGKIKAIKITRELLDHYFTSDNFIFKNKYSISNLIRYYNELILDMTVSSTSGKMRNFPNTYSDAYAKKLSGAELGMFYQHLISLGLVAKHDRLGNLIDFVKPPAQ